ncbi:MerR family transcriptional regulator [Nocardiopsis sp. TSRI0078]|uniref:MerR family transcriptional regulator n=1 Tax=unclassified Nocardiopsis TaxID=2649073 RepID=UPI00093C50C7|nr:helix-turn-helix domain-containing protein [Nocardiopsis sp. TSRI0078]OKI13673.1 MerR family transcriptional regulator [Nocardiopsis sp. TSRI0078]
MLPIGSFSELTGLSHKALRHYHSLGLLVPARVDEETQFRWYTVDQIERAGRIATLRRTGMGLDTVRRVVDDPGLAPEVLRRHAEDLRREREAQDRALEEASAALAWEPRVRVRPRPARTALTGTTSVSGEDFVLDRALAEVRALVERLADAAEERGWSTDGRWWKTLEPTPGGAAYRVCVPVAAEEGPASPLPGDVELREYGEGTEVWLSMPGPETLGGFTLALSHLLRHEVEGMYADVGTLRQMEHGTDVEMSVGMRPTE